MALAVVPIALRGSQQQNWYARHDHDRQTGKLAKYRYATAIHIAYEWGWILIKGQQQSGSLVFPAVRSFIARKWWLGYLYSVTTAALVAKAIQALKHWLYDGVVLSLLPPLPMRGFNVCAF